ncbi:glycolate oxidase subunit GlcE [Pseudothauera nasutitermitis]|uniref:Glycolate oxidase subunit GlcE n=1 Tax=Pseudothauera nasutitermitis TaxID=2565930 RepID=A0A4S4AZB3_9RHOO|nr:glycolate oxidase subunit GlcE [Pseudothauera nasutitermitis]THF65493.1 glycolate oxidase subunit GlcE [Pseudothauera nasutitermitis]
MSENIDKIVSEWAGRIRAAASEGVALRPRGGGSKDFYGRAPTGEVFDTTPCRGIVSYEPSELVVTVRAGTPLAELEAELAARGQMLAFEPPHFGPGATVGGAVAAGLSGPRRLAAGALRDFVLGVKLLDGRGQVLRFGGQVMKNVAGYDVSRLMAGSLGTLGVLLEVSLKVLPRPVEEATLRFQLSEAEAIARLNDWGGQPLPISASAWADGVLTLRLSGAAAAVRSARETLGGEGVGEADAQTFWHAVREQTLPWFGVDVAGGALWRLSLPTSAAPLKLAGEQFIEWGGGQRWLRSGVPAAQIRERVAQLGGHASLFRGGARDGAVFHPLPAPLMTIQRRLKAAFDPSGIFSPGRLHQEF